MNSQKLSNKGRHVVITGASKGIGRAIAMAFAAEGAQLYLCARNEKALTGTAAAIREAHPGCVVQTKACDIAVKEQAIDFANWVNTVCQKVDILVNNAGSFLPGSIYNEAADQLEKMIAVNLYSAYHVTQTLLPNMMAHAAAAKAGFIFNICSVASLTAYANGGSYSISKFALLGFSKNLREELKPHNIKVCAIMPGAVLTDSWGNFDNSKHRIMEAGDVADMVIAATKLSPGAVLEDLVLRPQLGDL